MNEPAGRVFPIEQLVKHTGERFQLAFAERAYGLLAECEAVAATGSHKGLLLAAVNEDVLSIAASVLDAHYGGQLVFMPPQVRYRCVDGLTMEPVMRAVITVPQKYMQRVLDSFSTRATRLDLLQAKHDGRIIIEGYAPMSALLGYRTEFSQMTQWEGDYATVFSHYSPVAPEPPESAA